MGRNRTCIFPEGNRVLEVTLSYTTGKSFCQSHFSGNKRHSWSAALPLSYANAATLAAGVEPAPSGYEVTVVFTTEKNY
jgi:hypothetical protein